MAGKGVITEIVDVKAFEQIVRLQDELTRTNALMNTLAATSIQLANNTKNATPTDAINNTKKLAQTTDLLVETQKKEVQQQNELIRSEANLNAATKQYAGSQIELRNNIAKLTKEHDRLNLTTKEGEKEARRLRGEINKLDEAYKKNATAAQAQAKNIGNYTGAWGKAKGAISGFIPGGEKTMGILGGLAGKMSMLVPSVGGVIGVMAGFKAILGATDTIADKFEKTVGGLKEGINVFFSAVANGDFTNFISNMKLAVEAGRRYAEVMDDLEDRQRALQIQDAKSRTLIIEQLKILRDRTKTEGERIAAAKKVIEIEDVNIKKKVANAKINLDAELELAKVQGISSKQLIELISNYDTYAGAMDKASKNAEILDKAEGEFVTTYNAMGRMTKQRVQGTEDQIAAAKRLTKEDLAWVDIWRRFGDIPDEQRKKITAAIVEYTNAQNMRAETELDVISRMSALMNKQEAAIEKEEKQTEVIKKKTEAEKEDADVIKYRQTIVENMTTASKEQIEAINKLKEAEKELWEEASKFKDVTLPWEKDSAELVDFETKVTAAKDAIKELVEEISDIGIETAGGIVGNLLGANYEDKISEVTESLESWHALQLQNIEERKNKGLISDSEYQKQKDKLEQDYIKKQKEAKTKAAKIEKEAALWQIAINTAVAIAKAAPNPILMALAAAAGISQAAIVASKPIPKFAKGTQNAPEGFAIVGERGSEMVIENGRAYMTPDSDTLTYLNKGAKVIPHDEVMQMAEAMGNPAIPKMTEKGLGYDITGIMTDVKQGIISAIKNKQETHINITAAGMRKLTRSANGWTEYINQNIKH